MWGIPAWGWCAQGKDASELGACALVGGGGRVHIPLGWQDILRGDTCEALHWAWCREGWACWHQCGRGLPGSSQATLGHVALQGPLRPQPPRPQLGPGGSHGLSSRGSRGEQERGFWEEGTGYYKVQGPGSRAKAGRVDRGSQGHQDASPGVDAQALSGSHGRSMWLLPGGNMQGPSRGAQAGLFGASKCPARLERSQAQPWSCPGRGPSPGRSSPEASHPGTVLSPR